MLHASPERQEDESHLIQERRRKLQAWRQSASAYPNQLQRSDWASLLHETYDARTSEQLRDKSVPVSVAGRMMLKRTMGKASFATLQDFTGRIQIYVSNDQIGETLYQAFKQWDLGDILAAKGHLFKTKTGELTVHVTNMTLLSKAVRPLPEKFHGLTDQEQIYRQRYLDLIMNERSSNIFVTRSKVTQIIRQYLIEQRYLEVETPMMHPVPGGAAARPFVTHHHTLDMPLYLRIAPELYLKRLIVGGLERVFEINRNFRNEGISTRHNPEFTMLESYEAYADYRRMMDITRDIVTLCAQAVHGSLVFEYQGRDVDVSRFDTFTLPEAIHHYHPKHSLECLNKKAYLEGVLHELGCSVSEEDSVGKLQLDLFEACTEELLWQPTFIVDYPIEVSPLARASNQNPMIAERFECFIAGRELANGYSELNDPEDQAMRFQKQMLLKEGGDDEAMHFDEDYVQALEYGMPPTGGLGVGIDRLLMLLCDAPSIRDVILFPQLRVNHHSKP